jgi:hypothetical protein
MKTIKSVTSNGLSYIDGSGIECFVDFKHCNDNWIQYKKRTENLGEGAVENLKKHDNCIGQRDICAHPCFIEFFTHPKFTRFEFPLSAATKEVEYSFDGLQQAIMTAGWSTLDLS